jgi:hypothetical protein
MTQTLPGWAHVLTTGPPGLASIAIFAVSFLSQLATGKLAAPTARRDGKGGREPWYPTQAKTRLDPDFLPRCATEVRVCAFH